MKQKIKTALGLGIVSLITIGVFVYAVLNSSQYNPQVPPPVTVAELKQQLSGKQKTSSDSAARPEQPQSSPHSPSPAAQPFTDNQAGPKNSDTTLPKTGPSDPVPLFLGTFLLSVLLFEVIQHVWIKYTS